MAAIAAVLEAAVDNMGGAALEISVETKLGTAVETTGKVEFVVVAETALSSAITTALEAAAAAASAANVETALGAAIVTALEDFAEAAFGSTVGDPSEGTASVQDDIVKDFGPFLAIDLRLGLLLMGWLRMTWDWSAVG